MPPTAELSEEICMGKLGSLQAVPDSFIWKLTIADSSSSAVEESISVTDFSDPDANTLIGNACKMWGVFHITNHEIFQKLLGDMESLCKTFFDMPLEKKLEAASTDEGASGYGEPRISPFFEKKMWSEGLTIIDASYRNHFLTLRPNDYTKYCEIIKEYEEHMQKLAAKLIWLAIGSLGVEEKDIKWDRPNSDFRGAQAAIQLNHYPICHEPDRAMGLPAQADSTLMTILSQNNTAGLQVFRDDVGWVTVPPVPGSLVVNVGDLLYILTNRIFPSVLHRARVNHIRSRFSMAYL